MVSLSNPAIRWTYLPEGKRKKDTMKRAIQTRHELNAPSNKVWDLIKTGEKWEDWFPILTGSKIENNIRYCELGDGKVLEERFLSSDAEQIFIYAVDRQNAFPASDIVGTIRLEAKDQQTTLHWTVEMTPQSEEVFPALQEMIHEMYTASAEKLEALANQN